MLNINKYQNSNEEIRQTLDGYWLGTQSGYVVTIPGLGSWQSETGIRGKNFPIWYHQVDGEGKVDHQKYNDDIDGYQPYDWDKEEYLEFSLFRNYDGKTVNSSANL